MAPPGDDGIGVGTAPGAVVMAVLGAKEWGVVGGTVGAAVVMAVLGAVLGAREWGVVGGAVGAAVHAYGGSACNVGTVNRQSA